MARHPLLDERTRATNRRQARRVPAAAALVVSLLVGLISWLTLTSTGAAASGGTRSGVYCSTTDPTCVEAFAAWRGKPVQIVGTFLPYATWSDIEAADSWLTPWSTNPYRGVALVTVPMLPKTGDAGDPTPTLGEGATGAYDSHFVTLAARLVGAGLGTAVIRLGHEMNGNWYAWAARPNPASYVAYWQHVVTAMRSVPGANFSFDWNVTADVVTWDARAAYPGDAYVDTIGADVYDFFWGHPGVTPQNRWAYIVQPGGTYSQGLQLWADFAASHNKQLSFAEWGLVGTGAKMSNGGEGDDDPYFVQQMAAWIASHNTAFEIYFNRLASDADHVIDNGHFPLSAAEYVKAVGDPATALGPSPLPSSWTPGSPTPSDSVSSSSSSSSTSSASASASTSSSSSSPKPSSTPTPSAAVSISLSTSNGRTAAVPLNGRTVKGSIYVFATAAGAQSVRFYLDDTARAKAPAHTEGTAPFDLAGTAGNGKANPYATTSLSIGKHTLTVAALVGTATRVVTATFTVTR